MAAVGEVLNKLINRKNVCVGTNNHAPGVMTRWHDGSRCELPPTAGDNKQHSCGELVLPINNNNFYYDGYVTAP